MFNKVDLLNWDRFEEYHLYTEVWPSCLYTLTKKVEVTSLLKVIKEKGIRFTPSIFYLITKALNSQVNFRYSYRSNELGYFDKICPLYPTINSQGNLSFHYVTYSDDFKTFNEEYLSEQEENKERLKVLPEKLKDNFYVISNAPFFNPDSFSFNLKNPKYYLLPMVETFKIIEENGKSYLPMSLTVNHAVVDLSHVNIFFNTLNDFISNFNGD